MPPFSLGSASAHPLLHQVNIFLPKLGKMRKVVERMQGFSKNVVLSANWEGEVTLSIETDDIKINTRWKNLRHPGSEDSESSLSST